MNGQMMNYKRYLESLERTPEHEAVVKPYAIDYKGLVEYARSKGVEPCDLSAEEKDRFILAKQVLA